MRIFARFALCIGALALFAGCATSQLPLAGPNSVTQAHARNTSVYRVLYSFDTYPNGEEPVAGLIDVGGKLYGSASDGGVQGCHNGGGCGTVFSITTKGAESLVYSFDMLHGVYPQSRLTDVQGTLYGTTEQGGPGSKGVVYAVTKSGSATVIHAFTGRTDGGVPTTPVINVHGTLYGTTDWGGMKRASARPLSAPECCGTVYSLTPSGAHTVLYRFRGGADGEDANSGLIDVNGVLYGTTSIGGAGSCQYGCGTFYSVTTTGKEHVLYSFGGGSDGSAPNGALIYLNGVFYGTTFWGGNSGCSSVSGSSGCGTVYSITTSGQEKLLYTFTGGSDGAHPHGVISVGGTFYGTAGEGSNGCGGSGCGVIYSLSTTGVETTLHAFAGGADGSGPTGSLIAVKGALYGTTYWGGSGCKSSHGCGTIFVIRP